MRRQALTQAIDLYLLDESGFAPTLPTTYTWARDRSAIVKDLLPALQAASVTLYYLPPYSPELNVIEHLWRHIKHEEMPVRSFTEADPLKATVDGVLNDHAAQIAQSTSSLCKAA